MAKIKEENPEVIDDSEGQVIQVPFDEHMVSKFIPYAMDVITSRALPDARDGMKPVQRRILYSMYSLGQHPNTKYRKCAHTVGNTLGALHPHG